MSITCCKQCCPHGPIIPKQPNVTSLNSYYLQKNAMEDSIEIVIEKLLHVSKDVVPKVIFSLTECYLYL